MALIQESLAVATRIGAAKPADFTRVIVDTTVQEKAIAFSTDARLMHRVRERLVRLARKHGIALRQSYERIGKHALIAHQRYAPAKQFKRANRRVERDIARKIASDAGLAEIFRNPLWLAGRVREQRQKQRGRKVYSLHAPEVEYIGKGKAHKPYEFGVKVSVTTTLRRSKGGQFVAHVKALPGAPYDGHTLATVIPAIEAQIGADLQRVITDRGHCGHNASWARRFPVFIAGQKRRVTGVIKRELRRRSAVDPVIGHLKGEHRMGRNHLAHATGDAINVVLAAAGYNFRRLLAWLALLLSAILAVLVGGHMSHPYNHHGINRVLHGRLDPSGCNYIIVSPVILLIHFVQSRVPGLRDRGLRVAEDAERDALGAKEKLDLANRLVELVCVDNVTRVKDQPWRAGAPLPRFATANLPSATTSFSAPR